LIKSNDSDPFNYFSIPEILKGHTLMKRITTRVVIKYWPIALAGIVFATDASAACSRESLRELTDIYVEAQTTGDATMLPLAASSYYGENDLPRDIAEGILSQAITPDFTRSFFDTTLCATFTELVAATHEHPYVIQTRMEVNDEQEVTVMESVVTDEGDWVFGAPAYLSYTQEEDWGVIPEDQRDMRGVIKAAAEAYINIGGIHFCQYRTVHPVPALRVAFILAPRIRKARPAPWGHSRNPLKPAIAASSLMRPWVPSASSIAFPGSMPGWGHIIRALLQASSFGLKAV